jgi:hypothetical protein
MTEGASMSTSSTELTPELTELLNRDRPLPPELVRQVTDFAHFLSSKRGAKPDMGAYGPVDYSEEWTEEDLRDFSRHSRDRLLQIDPDKGPKNPDA